MGGTSHSLASAHQCPQLSKLSKLTGLVCRSEVDASLQHTRMICMPELTWREANPALTKCSGNFLIDRLQSSMRSFIPSCTLSPHSGGAAPLAHSSLQNPFLYKRWGPDAHKHSCKATERTLPPASLSPGVFRACLLSAYVSKKWEGLFAWEH